MIALLDPSLRDHRGNASINLGDEIIHDAVQDCLRSIFPGEEVSRISTHTPLEPRHYAQIAASRLVFFGGTNVLSSDVRVYNQWKLSSARLSYVFPRVRNVILLGVGWWQYQDGVALPSRWFYRRVLSRERLHSLRDSYTKGKLAGIGIANTLNTCCPTTWKLDGVDTNRGSRNARNCLFTLTDYKQDPEADTRLIEIVLHHYPGSIFFFPQGSNDRDYLGSLQIYRANRLRIEVLEHAVGALEPCLRSSDGTDYIGTRLHGGTRCLERGMKSVIVAVDNRAAEIARDVNLPVIARDRLERLVEWIEGRDVFRPIRLPRAAIEAWKGQFA